MVAQTLSHVDSYKGRTIDTAKPVKVYRNLHSGRWSLQQGGVVVGHADSLTLNFIEFKVSEAGRRRVLKEKRKNVHAFAIGYIPSEHDQIGRNLSQVDVKYNPYRHWSFFYENADGQSVTPVTHCDSAVFLATGKVLGHV